MSFVGSVGLAIVSTDIDDDEHVVFAGVAFSGIYMYLLTFGCVAWYDQSTTSDTYEKRAGAMWPHLAGVCLAAPVLATVAFAVDRYTGNKFSNYGYVWEFIFVISVLGASLGLYIREPSPVHASTRLHARIPGSQRHPNLPYQSSLVF